MDFNDARIMQKAVGVGREFPTCQPAQRMHYLIEQVENGWLLRNSQLALGHPKTWAFKTLDDLAAHLMTLDNAARPEED